MNDDRLADLLFELLSGEVTVRDNQYDYEDWKYLIDHELVEHSKPKGSAGTRVKTITFRRLTDAGKQKLDSLQADG